VKNTKEKLLSVKEVSSRADISRQRVLQLIESNELQAEMVGRNYVIRESDFEAWSNSRRKAGRPPKAKIEEK
jgi:excisionase family DNA binding protein